MAGKRDTSPTATDSECIAVHSLLQPTEQTVVRRSLRRSLSAVAYTAGRKGWEYAFVPDGHGFGNLLVRPAYCIERSHLTDRDYLQLLSATLASSTGWERAYAPDGQRSRPSYPPPLPFLPLKIHTSLIRADSSMPLD